MRRLPNTSDTVAEEAYDARLLSALAVRVDLPFMVRFVVQAELAMVPGGARAAADILLKTAESQGSLAYY